MSPVIDRGPLSGLDALVFDFDGLILDTETSAYESTREVFVEHGLDLPLAEWQQFIGTADHLHWTDVLEQALGAAIDRSEVRPRRDQRKLELLASEVVLPGVYDLLVEAAEGGLGVAVASSSPAEWVGPHLERLDLAHRFAHVITRNDLGGDATRTKPAPDLYRLALSALGADPARSVAFEDSPNGLAAAKAAGMFCVAVPGGITRGLDFSAADLVVDSLAQVRLADLAPRLDAVTVTIVELRTERLLLRQWRDADRGPWAALNADPEVMEHFPATLDRAASDAFVTKASITIAARGWGLWAVEARADGHFVGMVGICPVTFDVPFVPAVEVGWRLARAEWGHGYATEAATAAVDFAFDELELDELVSMTTVRNRRSRAVMERLDFTHDPSGDFDHPRVPPDSPIRPHVLYRRQAP